MRRNTIAQSIVKRFRKNKISDVLVACYMECKIFINNSKKWEDFLYKQRNISIIDFLLEKGKATEFLINYKIKNQ